MSQRRSPFQSSTSTVTSPAPRLRPSDVTRGSSTTSSPSLTVSTSPYSRMTSSPTGTGSSGASPTGAVEYPKTGMRAGPIGPSKPGVADPLRLIKVEQNPLAQQAKQTVMLLEKQNTLKKELREEVVRDDDPGNWESSLSSWKNRRRSSSSYTPKVLDLVVEPDADFLAATTAATTTSTTADRRNGKTFQQLVDEKKERSDGNTNSSYMYDDDSPQSPVFRTENEQWKNGSKSSSVFQTETRQHLPKQHTSTAAVNPTTVEKSYRTPSTGLIAPAVDKYDKHEDVSVRQSQVEVRSTSTRVAAAAAAAGGGVDAVVNDVVHRRYKYSLEDGKDGKISPSVGRLENHSGAGAHRTAVNVEMRTTTTFPSGPRNNRPEVNAAEDLTVTKKISNSSNRTTFPAPRYPYSPDLNDNDIKSDHRHGDRDYGGGRTVTNEVTEFRKDTELSGAAPRVSLSSTADRKKAEVPPDCDDSGLKTTGNVPPNHSSTMTSSITVTLKQSAEAGDNSNRSISPSFSAQGLPKQGRTTEARQEQQTTSVTEKHVTTTTNKPEVNNGDGDNDVQSRSDHRKGNDTATIEEPVRHATEATDDEPPPLPNVPPPELDWDTYPTSGPSANHCSDDDDAEDGDAQIQNQGQGHGAQGGRDEDGSTREKMNRRRDEFLGLTVEKF